MTNLATLVINGVNVPISFVEHQTVKEGVTCDIYTFDNDPSKDLAVVVVERGFKTPLQKVLSGTETIEGYMSGTATLKIIDKDGEINLYNFPRQDGKVETNIGVGQTMQWEAETELMFYEVCSPPYVDGRYENLPE